MGRTKERPHSDPTKRFSNRVEYYIKYRPGYPDGLLQVLEKECGLKKEHVIADIGSGTGFLSQLFIKNGNQVLGVEPNEEMRKAAEQLFAAERNFISINGTAEATTLDQNSVDFITAGQAFHWFNVGHARAEFTRILGPEGWAVLVWNDRRIDTTPFLMAYENFLHEHGTDYGQVQHKTFEQSRLNEFFSPNGFKRQELENSQVFDFEGLKGRVLSSSYIPAEGHPKHEPMLRALQALYNEFQQNGEVFFEYDTKIFIGQLS